MTDAYLVNPRLADGLRSGRLAHGFFTREGGASGGLHEGLNCGYGSDDDPAFVAENRRRVAAHLGVASDALLSVYQVHGDAVVTVDGGWTRSEAPRADAMVTDRPGFALGILTADCAPVLFADATAGVIGAAHAGWKGARVGILEATVAAMRALGADPQRIVAAIGPTIGQASYEVGPEFRTALVGDDPENARFFAAGAGDRSQFDLPAYAEARLIRAGLERIERIGGDTAAEPGLYFSYRRACLRGETSYGRLISAITLRA